MDITNLVHQIDFILSTEPETRNSDITLTIAIWKRYFPKFIIHSEKTNKDYVEITTLFDLPREDNIKRVRAKIQNEERRYLPTDPAIFLERAKLSKDWREFLGYHLHKNPDTLSDFDYQSYITDILKPKQETLI